MIQRDRRDVTPGQPIPGPMLASTIREHQNDVRDRLEKLRKAYENDRAILTRRRRKNAPNARLAHGFARYISTVASGYLIGKPVAYTAPDGQEAALEAVTDAYARCDVASVDAELAKDASVFGRGVELTYADEQAQPRSVSLEPETAFVVYDSSAQALPLYGVYTQKRVKMDGTTDGYTLAVYTATHIYTYALPSLDSATDAAPEREEPHFFGAVPIVEFWNSEDERGDFEQVNGLIDAYDTLESDRVNDKTQFVDAILALYGATLAPDMDEEGNITRTAAQKIREDGILDLPLDAKAEFLTRALNEGDVQVLRDAIASDIHKFSMVPDLTDEHFAQNSSGVAIRYKLLVFEQLMRIKERWFREALRERLRLYANFLAIKGAPALDVERVSMVFTRSLPVNELEVSQMVRNLTGIVPQETLLGQVPFVDDPTAAAEEMRAAEEEKERQAAAREAALYSLPRESPPQEEREE